MDGAGGKGPKSKRRAKAGQNRKRQRPGRWRVLAGWLKRLGWRRGLIGFALLFTFGFGFYLAQLYGEISQLIEQRSAALTSAIYSAPLVISPGDDIAQLHLIDRLGHLSYTRVDDVTEPGEYSMMPGAMTVYARDFQVGLENHPAMLFHLNFSGGRVSGIADSFGVGLDHAVLEPEIIGRLLPDSPAERVQVSLNDLKPDLVKGLLATEDRFFYYHPGFDPIRIIEAAIVDFHSGHLRQGASTITQQLARTFLERHARTFHRKFRELAIALVLELRLSKRQILERYINDVPMGAYDGTPMFGLPVAARFLFNKDLREVSPAEAATLIGMIQAPTLYDPRRHPEECLQRRDTVLALMRRAGVIDQRQYLAAANQSIVLAQAPSLRRAPYFTDYVTAQVKKLPGLEGNLRGLKVYTTLDPEMQESARESVVDNLERLEKLHPHLRRRKPAQRLESSLVALDPRTGAIVAMVGGRDYATSQFNRAANAERQPGSAFKPIVYITALDPLTNPLPRPVTLGSILPDRPMSFGGWTPVNYERTYQGQVTVEEALAQSLNVPTAYLGSLLGPPTIIRTAREMGVREDLAPVLPIAIGADDMTLLELTGAYQVFADGGLECPPYAITAVVDRHHHEIYQNAPRRRRLMSNAVAYLMTGALRGVLQFGTGASSHRLGLDFPAAGKTGTTDDYRDAYFVGYTRTLVAGVWVGYDEPHSIGLPGADAALPAWVKFMTQAVRQPQLGFGPPPPGIVMATIDPTSGGLATPSCPRKVRLPFLEGTQPARICPLHGGVMASLRALTRGRGGSVASSSSVQAPPSGTSGTARNGLIGSIGGFFGSLFGHKSPNGPATLRR
ncbi:MAG: PBP1A family penicillin-binding protein [Candidatus Binataceae bacterium]